MSREERELKKQKERAEKHDCDGRCYWNTGMCPRVEFCDETRAGEFMASVIGAIVCLAIVVIPPIVVIGGAATLIWAIFSII